MENVKEKSSYFINVAAMVDASVRYDMGIKINVAFFFAKRFEKEQKQQQKLGYDIYKHNYSI